MWKQAVITTKKKNVSSKNNEIKLWVEIVKKLLGNFQQAAGLSFKLDIKQTGKYKLFKREKILKILEYR